MTLSSASRETNVGVLRDGRVVSLLPVHSSLSSGRVRWDGFSLSAFQNVPECEVPDHVHPAHMISLITEGSANLVWTTSGRTRRALYTPGDLYLLPAGIQDRIAWDRPTGRLILTIDPRMIAEAFEDTAHRQDFEIVERWTFTDRHVETLMLALRADLEDASPAGRLYGESIGLAIAVYLARCYGVPAHAVKPCRGGLPGYRLRLVLDYIQTHLDRDLRLTDLAGLAGMSPHYFAQLFRQSTGQSPHQYVLAERIRRAKRLLRNRSLSALDIAIRLGFADAGHFSKVFRRSVGSTPSDYRTQL